VDYVPMLWLYSGVCGVIGGLVCYCVAGVLSGAVAGSSGALESSSSDDICCGLSVPGRGALIAASHFARLTSVVVRWTASMSSRICVHQHVRMYPRRWWPVHVARAVRAM